jgi:hypothetical protein
LNAWLHNVLIGFDQLGNALTGGSADETLSSRTGRVGVGNVLDRLTGSIETDHSVRSIEWTPWGTVDPHHMDEVDLAIAADWDCLVQVLTSARDVDVFLPETMASAERAAKRFRLWQVNGGKERWGNRMARDVAVGNDIAGCAP